MNYTITRFCYKCHKVKPVVGGRMVRLVTGRTAFVCVAHLKGKKNDSLDKDTLLQPSSQLPRLSERSDCED